MGKTKFRAKKPYVGPRRNPKKVTKLKVIAVEKPVTTIGQEDLTAEVPSNSYSSASYKKMTYYGVELDMDKPTEIADNAIATVDCNFFVTLSCIQSF